MESTGMSPATDTAKGADKAWRIIFVELFLLVIAGAGAVYLAFQSVPPSRKATSASRSANTGESARNGLNAAIISPTVVPTQTHLSSSQSVTPFPSGPMNSHTATLKADDYKIIAAGKFELYSAGDNAGLRKELATSLDLNGKTFYMQKGSLVRVDAYEGPAIQVTIIKGKNLYDLDTAQKFYTSETLDNPRIKMWVGVLQENLPMLKLADDTANKIITWRKTGTSEWQSDWNWKTTMDNEAVPVQVKVSADPATNLITSVAIRLTDVKPWSTVSFQYEKVNNLTDLLTVPPDYTLVDNL